MILLWVLGPCFNSQIKTRPLEARECIAELITGTLVLVTLICFKELGGAIQFHCLDELLFRLIKFCLGPDSDLEASEASLNSSPGSCTEVELCIGWPWFIWYFPINAGKQGPDQNW